MNVQIADETMKVGTALASVPLDRLILNLAKGVAWGQYELDKVGVDITKMMGVPGVVSIGDEKLSMIEAGFLPSFYHFVDTILELKMEVSIREESSDQTRITETTSSSQENSSDGSVSVNAKASYWLASVEASSKFSWSSKSTSAYSRTVDATHSQKFSQDLTATSLMRTKLVPVPAPELLVERLKLLIEELRTKAKDGLDSTSGDYQQKLEENLQEQLKQRLFERLNPAGATP